MRKPLLVLLTACLATASAHDHIDVGVDPMDSSRLKMSGPDEQTAPLVPKGEFFSGYLPVFPGGYFANEITFAVEGNVFDVPTNSQVEIQILAVVGPIGSELSFWDGGSSPQRVFPNGWETDEDDAFAFLIAEFPNGEGHIHGRAFAMNQDGEYSLVVRAVDRNGLFEPSEEFTIMFDAVRPPPLSVAVSGGQVQLGFTSRAGMSYDLQRSTTLASDSWEWVDTLSSEFATPLNYSEAASPEPGIFFRLVEY